MFEEPSRLDLTTDEFEALLEYSTTLPTGTTVGKSWKRRMIIGPFRGAWWACEYVEHEDPRLIGIDTYTIYVNGHPARWLPDEHLEPQPCQNN